jgi:hypothetical protein
MRCAAGLHHEMRRRLDCEEAIELRTRESLPPQDSHAALTSASSNTVFARSTPIVVASMSVSSVFN